LGAGGTSRDGSVSGLVPLWKDGECLAVTGVQLAIEVNGHARRTEQKAPFSVEDLTAMACRISDMAETMAACGKK
jgi:hypothetical protein